MENTVNIVNNHDKDEKKVDINSEIKSADDFRNEIENLDFKNLAWWENFVSPALRLHEKIFAKLFFVRKFSLANPSANPSVENTLVNSALP